MSYTDIFITVDNESINASIAREILDKMEKLRMESNENNARRWIWELIQNAKDVAEEGRILKIEIDLSGNLLSFAHNGKCFSARDITFLIRQVSTKDRRVKGENSNKITGKFGTGFLSTHLLSEKVLVEGVLKEPEKDYKKFVLNLDRSGRTYEEVIESIEKAINQRSKISDSPSVYDFNPADFNTRFTYCLDSRGFEVAEKGIEDLDTSLPYVLTFMPLKSEVY